MCTVTKGGTVLNFILCRMQQLGVLLLPPSRHPGWDVSLLQRYTQHFFASTKIFTWAERGTTGTEHPCSDVGNIYCSLNHQILQILTTLPLNKQTNKQNKNKYKKLFTFPSLSSKYKPYPSNPFGSDMQIISKQN